MGLEYLIEPFKYDFMLRSLVTAIISGMMLPMLGSFTINRNMGFMADAMAHATMPVIAVGVFFGFSISALGLPAAIFVALFLGFVIKNTNIGEDTSIGIIFSSFFALGFVLISLLNVSINLEDLLFGQILAVSYFDMYAILALFIVLLIIFLAFYKQMLFYSFDPSWSTDKRTEYFFFKLLIFNYAFSCNYWFSSNSWNNTCIKHVNYSCS